MLYSLLRILVLGKFLVVNVLEILCKVFQVFNFNFNFFLIFYFFPYPHPPSLINHRISIKIAGSAISVLLLFKFFVVPRGGTDNEVCTGWSPYFFYRYSKTFGCAFYFRYSTRRRFIRHIYFESSSAKISSCLISFY